MDDKKLSLVEHLTELRSRLLISLIFYSLSFLMALFCSDKIYAFLTWSVKERLVVLGPNDILSLYLSISSYTALSLSLPFIVYQIWAFVRPGLTKKEAASILYYLPASFFCFLMGLAFAFYLLVPNLLKVLMDLGQGQFLIRLTASNYLDFMFKLAFPTAFLFEMPVIVAFFTKIGLLDPKFLVKYRRYIYFLLLFMAVVLTPADFVSDLALTVPLIALFEFSLLISWKIYRKKGH